MLTYSSFELPPRSLMDAIDLRQEQRIWIQNFIFQQLSCKWSFRILMEQPELIFLHLLLPLLPKIGPNLIEMYVP